MAVIGGAAKAIGSSFRRSQYRPGGGVSWELDHSRGHRMDAQHMDTGNGWSLAPFRWRIPLDYRRRRKWVFDPQFRGTWASLHKRAGIAEYVVHRLHPGANRQWGANCPYVRSGHLCFPSAPRVWMCWPRWWHTDWSANPYVLKTIAARRYGRTIRPLAHGFRAGDAMAMQTSIAMRDDDEALAVLSAAGERWGWQCADLSRMVLPYPERQPRFVALHPPDLAALHQQLTSKSQLGLRPTVKIQRSF